MLGGGGSHYAEKQGIDPATATILPMLLSNDIFNSVGTAVVVSGAEAWTDINICT